MDRRDIARRVAGSFLPQATPKQQLATSCLQWSELLRSQADPRSKTASATVGVLQDVRRTVIAHMRRDVAQRVAHAFMVKTAGEVRHVKDNSNDANSWAFTTPPAERDMPREDAYTYDPKQVKALAKTLRATNAALGHAMSGYTLFAKIKSRMVSPDGKLGGRGYIQRISEMRRAYMNVVEALSALSDTLHDEVHASHWSAASRQVEDIIEHADEIKENPEAWADEEISQDQSERT